MGLLHEGHPGLRAWPPRAGGGTNAAHLASWRLEASLDGDRWLPLSRHDAETVFQADWQVATWDIASELAFRFCPGRPRGVRAALAFPAVNRVCGARLCGRAGRSTARNGGSRPGRPWQ